jgi:hypothetical protein
VAPAWCSWAVIGDFPVNRVATRRPKEEMIWLSAEMPEYEMGLGDTVYHGVCRWRCRFFRIESHFSCVILKDIDSKTCELNVWVNSFTWPYNVGRELARWSYEHDTHSR